MNVDLLWCGSLKHRIICAVAKLGVRKNYNPNPRVRHSSGGGIVPWKSAQPIEYFWGMVKKYLRDNCDYYSFDGLKENLFTKGKLDSVPNNKYRPSVKIGNIGSFIGWELIGQDLGRFRRSYR